MQQPQFIDMRPQLSLRNLEPQNPYGMGFEAHLEKQNRVLAQLMGSIAKQEQIESYKMKLDLNQKIQELELSKLRTEIELEKQKSRKYQSSEESQSPKKTESSSPRKEPSSLEKVVMSLILQKSPSIKSSGRPSQGRIGSLPSIKERHFNFEVQEEDEEEIYKKPQQKVRPRVVITRREATPVKVLRHQQSMQKKQEDEEHPTSLAYLDDKFIDNVSTISQQRSSMKKLPNNSKKNIDEDTTVSRVGSLESLSQIDKEKSPRKKKLKQLKENEDRRSAILILNEELTPVLRSMKSVSLETPVVKSVKSVTIKTPSPREDNKKKLRSRLKGLTWLLVYPRILYKAREKHVLDDKQAFDLNVSPNIGQIYEMSKIFIQDAAGNEIVKMLTDNSFSYALSNLSATQAKKSEKMCIALMGHLKQIFNKLIINMGNFPAVLPPILSTLIQEDGFLQNDYFSQFEINRMKFGPFGTIREMNSQRCKLILGGVVMIRVFIYYFIMRPWEVLKQDRSKFKSEKLLNIGSILYNTLMGIFRNTVPAYPNNQSFLSVELKIRPKKNTLPALEAPDPENPVKNNKDTTKDGDIIQGFYNVQQLSSFFDSNKKTAEELKQVLSGFLEAIYEKVAEV